MAHSATPRPTIGHVVWTTFGWILYVAAALYLLLRAEGYTLNIREAVVLETGVVTADFTHPVHARLDGVTGSGTLLEFRDLPPGRHRLDVSADGRMSTSIFVDAVPRRVTRIARATLALNAPTPLTVRSDVHAAAISPDQRFAGFIRTDAHTVEVVRVASDAFEPIATIPLPSDITATSIWWPLQEQLVILAADRALLVTLPDRVREVPLRNRPVAVLPVPGAAVVLLQMENREILSLSIDGSAPQRVLDAVDAVGVQRSGAPLFVRANAVSRMDGKLLGPALPRGVVAVGIEEQASGILVWDRNGQGWLLVDDAWQLLEFPVGGTLRGAGSYRVGAGALRDEEGLSVLQLTTLIARGEAFADDLVLLQSAESLLQCSLALRQCTAIATDVRAFWTLTRGVLIQQGTTVSFLEIAR